MARGAIVDKNGNVVSIIDAVSDNDPKYCDNGAFVASDSAEVGDVYDSKADVFVTTAKSETHQATLDALRIAMAEFGLTEDAINRIIAAT